MHCGFCGKSQHDVQVLIAGPNTFICNECVTLCDDIVGDRELERHLRDPEPDADTVAATEAHLADYTSEQLVAYLARAEESIAKEQRALDGLDGPEDAMPDDLRRTLSHGNVDRATLRARLTRQNAARRKSVEIVARVLASRS